MSVVEFVQVFDVLWLSYGRHMNKSKILSLEKKAWTKVLHSIKKLYVCTHIYKHNSEYLYALKSCTKVIKALVVDFSLSMNTIGMAVNFGHRKWCLMLNLILQQCDSPDRAVMVRGVMKSDSFPSIYTVVIHNPADHKGHNHGCHDVYTLHVVSKLNEDYIWGPLQLWYQSCHDVYTLHVISKPCED